MKTVLVFFSVIFLNAPLLARSDMMIFKGSGTWKDNTGMSGGFTSVVQKIFNPDGSIKVIENIQTETGDFTNTTIIKPTEFDTSTIHAPDGTAVGSGYCFPKEGTKICHCDINAGGEHIEKTKHISLDGYHEMGSSTGAEGHKVMWSGSFKRVYPKSK